MAKKKTPVAPYAVDATVEIVPDPPGEHRAVMAKQTDESGRRKPDDPLKEADQIRPWQERIDRAINAEDVYFKDGIRKQRGYVNGSEHNDGEAGLVRTNLIYSTIATILPHVYAKDPDIEVTVTEAVDPNEYDKWKKFAKGLEVVLDRLVVRRAALKKRMKSNVRSTMTTSVGWLKMVLQQDPRVDPILQSRITDTQTQLEQIKALIAQVDRAAETSSADLEAKRMELDNSISVLNKRLELDRVKTIVIDRILTEDMLILDDTIQDFDYYPDAEALAHGAWMTADKYETMYGYVPPEGAQKFVRPSGATDASSQNNPKSVGAGKNIDFYRVWEVWHKKSMTVYTFAQGAKAWARMPFHVEAVGVRWYPFFCLGFNLLDGQWRPMSDVDLLKELQDEYNTTRTNFAEARKSAIPVIVVRKGGELTEKDIENIRNRKINQIIAVEGVPGKPISDELAFVPIPDLDPKVYETGQIRADIELMSGTADAARGNVTEPKTATEAQIMQQGLMTRTGERQDAIEDVLTDMSQYAAEISLLCMTKDDVRRIAGQATADLWPEHIVLEDIFDMLQIRVRGGSTGKPNKMKEREQWMQMLPEIQNTLKLVFDLQAAGNLSLAKSSIELLQETLERFDEYIDLDRFIPPELRDGDQMDATAKMMQELQQCKEQLTQMGQQNQELTQELQQTQQQAQQAQQGLEAKIQQGKQDYLAREHELQDQAAMQDRELQAKVAQERRKANFDNLQANAKIAADERLKNADIAGRKAIADAQLQANKIIEEAKVKSEERIQCFKLVVAQLIKPAGPGAPGMAGDGGKSEAITPDVKALHEGVETVLTGLQETLKELAEAMSADSVPIRDADGLIERVTKKKPAKVTSGS